MTDVDDLVGEALGTNADEEPGRTETPDTDDEWTGHEMDRPGTYVCDEMVDGKPCGKTYRTKRALAGHTTATHRFGGNLRHSDKSGQAKQKPKPKPKAKAAATQASATPVDTGRAGMYATSITAAALIAHLAAGQYFDGVDLDIVTKGAPGLGDALDAVADKHEAVRTACDAILGGASGAVYIQLFIAASAIAVPILAHHGMLPASTGERFAAMTGAMIGPVPPMTGTVPSPPPPPGGEGTTPTGLPPDPTTWTMEEWQSVLFQMPPRIMGDILVAQGIGDVAPPTIVDVPPSFSTPAGANGSEPGTADEPEGVTVPAET